MYSSVSLLHPRVVLFASPEEKKTGHCCIIRRELNPDEVLNKKKCGEITQIVPNKTGKKTQQPGISERVGVCVLWGCVFMVLSRSVVQKWTGGT